MKQMQVTSAESASGDFQNNIPGLNDLGPGSIDDLNLVLRLPHKRLHGLTPAAFCVVGDILLCDGAAIVTNGLFGLESCLCNRHDDLVVMGIKMKNDD